LEGSRRAERERARWETKQRQDPLSVDLRLLRFARNDGELREIKRVGSISRILSWMAIYLMQPTRDY